MAEKENVMHKVIRRNKERLEKLSFMLGHVSPGSFEIILGPSKRSLAYPEEHTLANKLTSKRERLPRDEFEPGDIIAAVNASDRPGITHIYIGNAIATRGHQIKSVGTIHSIEGAEDESTGMHITISTYNWEGILKKINEELGKNYDTSQILEAVRDYLSNKLEIDKENIYTVAHTVHTEKGPIPGIGVLIKTYHENPKDIAKILKKVEEILWEAHKTPPP